MALVATYGAAVATVNLAKTHYKPLPTRVRAKLKALLTQLGDHAKHLRADLTSIEEIFRSAHFPKENTIRLGNGAYLMPDEFARYRRVSDNVLRRLRDVHRLSIQIEKVAAKSDTLQIKATTNVLGKVYEDLDQLLESRNLSFEEAWLALRQISDGLEQAIADMNSQLDSDMNSQLDSS